MIWPQDSQDSRQDSLLNTVYAVTIHSLNNYITKLFFPREVFKHERPKGICNVIINQHAFTAGEAVST